MKNTVSAISGMRLLAGLSLAFSCQPAGEGDSGLGETDSAELAFQNRGWSAEYAQVGVKIDGLGVRFAGVGREGAFEVAVAVEPERGECELQPGCLSQTEYRRGDVVEWWTESEDRLQQGWTLESAIGGDGPLALEVEIEGAEVSVSEQQAWLTEDGGRLWSVGGLKAWDARGEELPVWFEESGSGFSVMVDDEGAEYPVVVDPVYAVVGAMLTPPGGESYFGGMVDSAGDLNGDGYADVVALAHSTSTGPGTAYVFAGSATGLDTAPLASYALPYSWGSAMGYAAWDAGDTNADGYDDLVIGEGYYQSMGMGVGRVRVFAGGPSGPAASPTREWIGDVQSGEFGGYVDASGDVNGDGFADVLVGQARSGSGKVHVFYGGAGGASAAADEVLLAPSGTYFGVDVGTADVNGDGFGDVLVGQLGVAPEGAAYVFHGGGAGVSATPNTAILNGGADGHHFANRVVPLGDMNGDGFEEVGVTHWHLQAMFASELWIYEGGAPGLVASPSSVLPSGWSSDIASGDLNADGLSDLVVADRQMTNFAKVSTFHGTPLGVSHSSAPTLTGIPNYSGYALASADVNGDDFDDVVVGSDPAGNGKLLVFFGTDDADGDGVTYDLDCDDFDPGVGIGALRYPDGDGDGYGLSSGAVLDCGQPLSGYATLGGDCNDAQTAIYPTASETIADGIDQDCDLVDSCYMDTDNDNYGTSVVIDGLTLSCAADAGRAPVQGDCKDSASGVNPGATDTVGDSIDQDCDLVDSCYTDTDNDNYGTSVVIDGLTLSCAADAGRAPVQGDCKDSAAGVNPGATETVGDSIDQDCDLVDSCYADADNDNYGTAVILDGLTLSCTTDAGRAPVSGDCNDTSALVYVGATEVTADGIDQDCNGGDICYVNADNDGYRTTAVVASTDLDCTDAGEAKSSVPSGDCNDASNLVYPGAPETAADGIDQDCDLVDSCYTDADNDGFGTSTVVDGLTLSCANDAQRAAVSGDCNDALASAFPAAPETVADGIDQDCDTVDSCYTDADNDGFGTPTIVDGLTLSCANDVAKAAISGDCNDTSNLVYPTATETPADGIDQDCDTVDSCYTDADNDEYGVSTVIDGLTLDCVADLGRTNTLGDCNDGQSSIHPDATEVLYNGVDEDCDGDDGVDNDLDGYGGEAFGGDDCHDEDASVHPGATESIDGVDEDCDGMVDEHTAAYDDDGDGFTENGGDCDDSSASRHPGALEVVNTVDDDCDGLTDEASPADADGDTFTIAEGDCHDQNAAVHPGAAEVVNGLDDNCDGRVDEGTADYDDDGDGFTENGGDCDDADENAWPSAQEMVNALDDNCNGVADEGTTAYDDDSDGQSEEDGDCDDSNQEVYEGAVDVLNGVDDDCDGAADEETDAYDDDGDGLTEEEGDCDDSEAGAFPGAPETGNGLDDDCDGVVDENTAYSDDDGDGFTEAQGDCNDAVGSVNPGVPERCSFSDDLPADENCDGEIDEECAEEPETVPTAHGCASAPETSSLWALALALPWLRRRRG